MNDRNSLMDLLRGYSIDTEVDLEYVVDHLISEGVEIRPRAVWETENGHTTCSVCHYPSPIYTVKVGFGTTQMRAGKPSFCPHCGAKMIGR